MTLIFAIFIFMVLLCLRCFVELPVNSDQNMKSLLVIDILLVLNMYIADCNQILFLDYCLSGSVPEPFPVIGEKSSGGLLMSKSPENGTWYRTDMNCTVILSAKGNHLLLLTFSNVSLRNSSLDNLTVDYNSGESSIVLSGQQVCSNENCEGLKFDSGTFNNVTLKFLSSNVTIPQNVTGFKAHYTVYDLVGKNGACKDSNQFLCENGHCIWTGLLCDGHNNCGDRSDETKCLIPVPDTIWGIVVIVVAILAVLVFVPVFCCLATFGTRSPVKSVTVANQLPTPLLPTTDCGETSGLLTSSDVVTACWPGTSYDRSNSVSYGTSQVKPPINSDNKRHRSMSQPQGTKFL